MTPAGSAPSSAGARFSRRSTRASHVTSAGSTNSATSATNGAAPTRARTSGVSHDHSTAAANTTHRATIAHSSAGRSHT
ncbi:MAG: hypothetical protein D6693_00695 [Planctomycetota bacterium]|nr:MAG: hypothetical protein D6693_00695 [Planctomycetota bacterium]